MRTKRRRYQRGCLRNANGSWIVKYYDADGRQRTETIGRSIGPEKISRNEAERRRAELIQRINNEPKRESMTFGQFVDQRFLPVRTDDVLKSVRAGSVNRQQQRLNAYILPVIADVRLADLEQEHLRDVLRRACAKPSLGNSTLKKIRVDLMHVCRFAAGEGFIDRPIWEKLPVPESSKAPAEKPTVTLDQYRTITNALTERDRLAFDLVMFGGLRQSEVFALQVGDLQGDHLRIERSVYEGKINRPKTDDSRRLIGLPAAILARLRAYAEGLPANDAQAWLFPSSKVVKPEWPDNAMDNRIRPALEPLGYKWINFAVLRRTFSSLHRKAGTDLDLIAYQQGHTKSTHLDDYVQYSPAMTAAALERVYSQFLGMPQENRAN
ncbi:MAG: site-specific integrase [Bryobacteraceae bacterium]